MAIIQSGQLNNIFSRVNAETAAIERVADQLTPYIVSPYFLPNSLSNRNQPTTVKIYVENVYFGASVSFGSLVSVSNVKYFRYNNSGIREQIVSNVAVEDPTLIDLVRANEIECDIILPSISTIPNNTKLLVTITNPNGSFTQNNSDFIVSDGIPDSVFPNGNLRLKIESNRGNDVGIIHRDGVAINNTRGPREISIPFSEIKDKSIKIEFRDNSYITDSFYRISINKPINYTEYAIFIEKWDPFDNVYIKQEKSFVATDGSISTLSFNLWQKTDTQQVPQITIVDAKPNPILKYNLDQSIIDINYNCKNSTNVKYQIFGVNSNGSEEIISQVSEIKTQTNEILNGSKILKINKPDQLKKFIDLKVKFTPYYNLPNVNNLGETSQTFELINGNTVNLNLNINNAPNFTISTQEILIPYSGGNFSFNIITDDGFDWAIQFENNIPVNWLTINELNGKGSKTISGFVTQNTNTLNRNILLIFKSADGSITFPVNLRLSQALSPQKTDKVEFYFDFDTINSPLIPNQNTKDQSGIITVPYYIDETTNNIIRITDTSPLPAGIETFGLWDRTNPISLFGRIINQNGSITTLNWINKVPKNLLLDNQYYVDNVQFSSVRLNFQSPEFWSNSNVNFLAIPNQITSFLTREQNVTYTIIYKVNGTLYETQVYYKLNGIVVRNPIFTLTPNVINVKVDSIYKTAFGYDGPSNIEVLGTTKVENIQPRSNIDIGRNIFSIIGIEFYRNWKTPTQQRVNYVAGSNVDSLKPNIFGFSINDVFSDQALTGIVKIRYKNNIGDIRDYELIFNLYRTDVLTPSSFTINPSKKYVKVNKNFIPISTKSGTQFETFRVTVNGFEPRLNNDNFEYSFTPFEPSAGYFTITNVEFTKEESSDRIEFNGFLNSNAIPPNRQNQTFGYTQNYFEVYVYNISKPIYGKATIRYRNTNQNIPIEIEPLTETVYFEIIPDIEGEDVTPPTIPTYTIVAKPNADLLLPVDCNNSILGEILPVSISVTQTNTKNTNDVKILNFTQNSNDPKSGEFKIVNVTSDVDNLNFLFGNDNTITLQRNFLDKSYVVNVTIEYRDDNLNLNRTYTSFKINRIAPKPYVVTFTPNPSNINVIVDYTNQFNINSISTPSIKILADETDLMNNTRVPLRYTTGDLVKGTYKIKKIEGFVLTTDAPATNEIFIPENGILEKNHSIKIFVDYIDSCGASKSNVQIFIPVNRIAPRGQEVLATIKPNFIDVEVDFRRSLVQTPIPFPEILVELSEREVGSGLAPIPMQYTQNNLLNKNQFKIKKVYGNSIDSYELSSFSKFRPSVKKILQSEYGYAEIEYKDISGKEGTTTLQFYLNRIQLPQRFSKISVKTTVLRQVVIVSDNFDIIDQTYDEIKNIPILATQILPNDKVSTPLKFVKLESGKTLTDDSTYTINSIFAYEEDTNKFVDYVGFEILNNGEIRVLANQIKSNIIVKINTSYIDYYGNSGKVDIVSSIIPDVTPPIITRIEYPEGINARDYIGFNQDFDVTFESEFSTNVAIYVTNYGENYLYQRYKPDSIANFNMQDLISRFGIDTGDGDTFDFTLILVPERFENNKYKEGQYEDIVIQFNKSNIQIPRPFIINNLNNIIKPKFDFTIYKDEVAKYLNHYLHFDNEEPRLIANWERDDITFSEFEVDELGNEIPTSVNPTLVLKMYEPLPEDITVNTSIWISKQRS